MGVFPNSKLLKISMISSSLVGIFPWEFMFDHDKRLKKMYRAFSNIILSYYIFFLSTQYVQLYFLITDSIIIKPDEISENLSLTICYTVTSIRQLIIKNSRGFLKIIEYVIETENKKAEIDNEETGKIEDNAVKKCQRIGIIYIGLSVFITLLYFYRPFTIENEIREIRNVTQIIKHFPVSSWFPFDEQKYFKTAYFYQIISGCIGASYVTYTDIFMCNLIIFPTGQLKKLQHFFRDFKKFKLKIKEIYGILDDDKAGQITCVYLIEKHRKLIAYIDYFNNSMDALMVFDFIQSSIQMASILTQSIGLTSLISIILTLSFLLRMILRLCLYYYFANDVIVSSEELSLSIWKCNWYEESPRTKFLLLMVMMRCRKCLSLNIGPFSIMSVQSAFSILKAAYSYFMLTMHSFN